MLAGSETLFEVLDMDPDFEARCEEARASERCGLFLHAAIHWRAAALKAPSEELTAECLEDEKCCLIRDAANVKRYLGVATINHKKDEANESS